MTKSELEELIRVKEVNRMIDRRICDGETLINRTKNLRDLMSVNLARLSSDAIIPNIKMIPYIHIMDIEISKNIELSVHMTFETNYFGFTSALYIKMKNESISLCNGVLTSNNSMFYNRIMHLIYCRVYDRVLLKKYLLRGSLGETSLDEYFSGIVGFK